MLGQFLLYNTSMLNTETLFIENLSNTAVSIFYTYEPKYWKSLYQQFMQSWWNNSTVPKESMKEVEKEVKRKVSELDKKFTYAKIIVGV